MDNMNGYSSSYVVRGCNQNMWMEKSRQPVAVPSHVLLAEVA
jgi:hypothetical protein